MKNEKVGFIGIGQMGKPMALNLKKAGYDVHVFDVNKQAMQEIAKHDISIYPSCRDLSLNVDKSIIVMVRDFKQARDAIFGNKGIAASGRKGLNILVTSTIGPSSAKELGMAASKIKYRMLNAPVSGARHGAEQGSLSLIVSGDEDLYKECKPLFNAIGEKVFYFGSRQESAQGAKLANNLILGVNMIGCLEGFRFAESMGIPEKKFKELLTVSTGNSWVVQNWDWFNTLWEQGHGRPESSIALMYKDFLAAINEGSLPLPLASLVSQFFLDNTKS